MPVGINVRFEVLNAMITDCKTKRRFGGFITLPYTSLVRMYTISTDKGSNIRVPTLHCVTPVVLDQVNI